MELPSGAQNPGETGMQAALLAAPVALEAVPPGQGVGRVVPTSQYDPVVHVLHAVAPWVSWNSPDAHGVHVFDRDFDAKEPGRHGVYSLEPIAQLVPSGQGSQSSSLNACSVLRYVP